MKANASNLRGFSLIEVVLTIAVVSFAFVGLIGMFPVALEQTRSCVDETRSAQLARMTFSTLAVEDFHSAKLFGADDDQRIDLATLDGKSTPLYLYGFYDVRNQARIVRTTTVPATAEYRLELRFQPSSSVAADGSVRGTLARLRIVSEPKHKPVIFEGSEFIVNSGRAVFTK